MEQVGINRNKQQLTIRRERKRGYYRMVHYCNRLLLSWEGERDGTEGAEHE